MEQKMRFGDKYCNNCNIKKIFVFQYISSYVQYTLIKCTYHSTYESILLTATYCIATTFTQYIFSNLSCRFLDPNYFSNLLDLNLQKQVKKEFCF